MYSTLKLTGALLALLTQFSMAIAAEDSATTYYNQYGHQTLEDKIAITLQKGNTAKNIIVFVGSGLSPATLAGARVYNGDDNSTFVFENFNWSGQARTYCIDKRVADSACAATAILTGVKSKFGTYGMTPDTDFGDCTATKNPQMHLDSIAKWALDGGKAVGFATTMRVTTGVAPALYAHVANKNWESDGNIACTAGTATDVSDIASQLINGPIGKQLRVVFGGGRKNFIPNTVVDEDGLRGVRSDGRNLLDEWKAARNGNATFITKRSELASLDTSKIDYLFGLFEYDNLHYNLDVVDEELTEEPALVSMVHYSLEMLQKAEHSNGFLLFVEDGLINEAHKENKPNQAFNQVKQYATALNMAKMMVSESNTLLLSMSDVGSTLSISGYSDRSNDLETAGVSDIDNLAYQSLSYATGPSHSAFFKSTGGREDPTTVDATAKAKDKRCSATVPLSETANGGEDVTVFAHGAWSHIFSGSYEQSFIAHAITYASCLNNYCSAASTNAAIPLVALLGFGLISLLRFHN